MRRSHRARALTLLELLAVIAVIGLLVSVLLPALGSARRAAQGTACLSNLRQAATSFLLYAQDNDGTIPGTFWQGSANLDWAGANNASYLANPGRYSHPLESSVLWRYVAAQDRIFECPTVRREANRWYDYTVVIRMAGARIETPWQMTYPLDPAKANSDRRRFAALPLLIEEDTLFYNRSFPDGSFAAADQFSDRHRGGANLGYLDGSASRFEAPGGPNSETVEAGDLEAFDLRLHVQGRLFSVALSNAGEFGWINRPK